jgi:hypothetical protein
MIQVKNKPVVHRTLELKRKKYSRPRLFRKFDEFRDLNALPRTRPNDDFPAK